MIEKFLFIIGGLFLFIYGINLLSFHLTKINKNKINFLINKAKKNKLSALVIGILITTIFQSSSAVSVILIAFITSKLLDLKSACFILMGANLGSTLTTYIISLDISKYYMFLIIIGCAFLIKGRRISLGNVLFGLGMFFLGLSFVSDTICSLILSSSFNIKFGNNIFVDFLISIFFTSIIQSSAASLKILQDFCNVSLLSNKTMLAFVMGANIGSTITGILASIKSSKEAKKLAAFNFFFNLSTALFIFVFFEFISSKTKDFINYFSFSSSNTITFLHFVFNLLGIFIWSIFDALFELKKKINSNKLIKKEI